MAGAAELPRPGVEVIQEFTSATPTIVTPTLVPCNVAPFFEVIEALESDGTLNEDAKLEDMYEQLELTVSQSSFPSPRGNIDEVDVLEDDIRVFFEFGGSLLELERDSAFLTSFVDPTVSKQPWILGTVTEPVSGYGIDGRTLVVQFDSHNALPPTAADVPASDKVTITFAGATPGANLTLQQVIDQINAVIPGVASKGGVGTDQLLLSSTKYGAAASVCVRADGTANPATLPGSEEGLGFSSTADQISIGSGFYAYDDNDGDRTSPRLRIYQGTEAVDIPGGGTITEVPFISPASFKFTDASVLPGDAVIADGVDIGEVIEVESLQLTMAVEQNLPLHDSPFGPRRVVVQANELTYPAPAASAAATVTGTRQTEAATPAYIVGTTAPTYGPIPLGEAFTVEVYAAGVSLGQESVTVTGTAWSDLAGVVGGINGAATTFEAYAANENGVEQADGTYLGLRTKADNTGSDASITFVSQTSGMTIGFDSGPYSDVGENIRYLPGTPAIMTSADTWANILTAGLVITDAVSTTINVKNPATGAWGSEADSVTWNDSSAVPATVDDAVTFWNSVAKYTTAYKSDVGGVASATGTYLSIKTHGESVGVAAQIDTVTDTIAGGSPGVFGAAPQSANGTDDDLDGTTFKWSLDNNPHVYMVTLIADEDDGGTSLQQVLDKINELTPGVASASSDSPPYLTLDSLKKGEASEVEIVDGTANSPLGLTDNSRTVGAGRPDPDLAVDISGNVVIQSQILRDGLTGVPFDPGFAPIIVAYKGLRLDLSPDADNPSLLVVNDTTTLEAAADPISTDNPGALMTYLSLLNAPTVSVAAIGVPEISADAPDGTPLGYSKCADFLENEEVYAIATGTHSPVVHQAFLTHVNAMSEPEQKGERIYFFNPRIPDRALPTLVGSGTDANSTANDNEVTVEVNLAPELIANGIDPNLAINPLTGAIENEVYLDLGGDDQNYLVQEVVAGTTVKLRTTFATGENADAFYSSTALTSTVISDDWTVKIRGDELLMAGTTDPDRERIAETIQAAAQTYGFRRGFYVHPDQCGINVTGLEQLVEGYYATACIVGMVGQQPPQQGFTNFPITGLTRVVGSNDKYTNRHLNIMAAGGVYILVQDAQGAPITCRHQLSTDLTSIEARELSITKVVDFTAKFMRAGLRNYIGRSNITQPFLDNLATVVEGQLGFLSDTGVLIGGETNNIIQDADAPDTVLIDVTLDVPYPCNYIRLTLVV
jgi:hypothetical protein